MCNFDNEVFLPPRKTEDYEIATGGLIRALKDMARSYIREGDDRIQRYLKDLSVIGRDEYDSDTLYLAYYIHDLLLKLEDDICKKIEVVYPHANEIDDNGCVIF